MLNYSTFPNFSFVHEHAALNFIQEGEQQQQKKLFMFINNNIIIVRHVSIVSSGMNSSNNKSELINKLF